MTVTRLEMPDWKCMELLERTAIGRLCIIEQGYPLAFPVNFKVIRQGAKSKIVVRATPLAGLARYQGPASLEIDAIDAEKQNAWSVIVRGTWHRVLGQHELPDTYPMLDGRTQWMLLDITAVSGREFSSAPTHEGFSVPWQLAQ